MSSLFDWILRRPSVPPPSPSPALLGVCEGIAGLSRRRVGALIAFERRDRLTAFSGGGVEIDAVPSSALIESIFTPPHLLHHGAVVIDDTDVVAASCLLPLSDAPEHATLGCRRRAAAGLATDTDAVVVGVSEESGAVFCAANGRLRGDVPPGEVASELAGIGVRLRPRRIPRETRSPGEVLSALEAFLRAAAITRLGTIIAIDPGPGPWESSGTELDARVSSELLHTIHSEGSPLSRGAVLMQAGRISRAGCELPLCPPTSERLLARNRHRAALGLSAVSPALVVTVSAASGQIQFVQRGDVTSVNRDHLGAALAEHWRNTRRRFTV